MLKMANAASQQALEEFKRVLREFLESSETGRQAIAMSGSGGIAMQKLNGYGKAIKAEGDTDDDDGDDEIYFAS
jgi:protein SEY1